MITAIDTNILIDVLEPDLEYGPASREYLKRCRSEGAIVACGVIWAEVASSNWLATGELVSALETIGLEYSPMNRETAVAAATIWRRYRGDTPGRHRIASDFLIGAHARVQCDRLLTRDRGFYRAYFEGLRVVDPSGA